MQERTNVPKSELPYVDVFIYKKTKAIKKIKTVKMTKKLY